MFYKFFYFWLLLRKYFSRPILKETITNERMNECGKKCCKFNMEYKQKMFRPWLGPIKKELLFVRPKWLGQRRMNIITLTKNSEWKLITEHWTRTKTKQLNDEKRREHNLEMNELKTRENMTWVLNDFYLILFVRKRIIIAHQHNVLIWIYFFVFNTS